MQYFYILQTHIPIYTYMYITIAYFCFCFTVLKF